MDGISEIINIVFQVIMIVGVPVIIKFGGSKSTAIINILEQILNRDLDGDGDKGV